MITIKKEVEKECPCHKSIIFNIFIICKDDICLNCGKQLIGDNIKKFCCDRCRYSYRNSQKCRWAFKDKKLKTKITDKPKWQG